MLAKEMNKPKKKNVKKHRFAWLYQPSKPLVRPEEVKGLSTQLRTFHDWYMQEAAAGRTDNIAVFIRDHLFNGHQVMWLNLEDIFEIYQQNALDVALICTWIL